MTRTRTRIRTFLPFLAAALASALLAACSQTPAPPAGAAPAADIQTLPSVEVGDSVVVDGTGSSGDGVSYSWSFSSVPAGSAASFSNPTSAITTFNADKAGSYVVELTVSSSGESDSVVAVVTADEADVRGVWNGVLTPSGGGSPGPLNFELTQSSGVLGGTLAVGPGVPMNGTIHNGSVLLSATVGTATLTVHATLSGDGTTMNGTFVITGSSTINGAFTATRAP